MKNNLKKFLSLDIQLFAEESDGNNEEVGTDKVQEEQKEVKADAPKEKLYTRDEVNKMINAEKQKIKKEAEAEKNEAEKLAKMDSEDKLKYELDSTKKELAEKTKEFNALTLKHEAIEYATSKSLPIGYIEDLNFESEDAESIKTKIDKLSDLRSKDLSTYLNDNLKEKSPKAVDGGAKKEDPYLTGYKNYMNNLKK